MASLKSWQRRFLLILADVVSVSVSAAIAYFCFAQNATLSTPVFLWWAVNAVCAVAVFLFIGLYRFAFFSIGFPEALKLVVSAAFLGVANLAFALITKSVYIGVGTAILYALSLLMCAAFVRFSRRLCAYLRRSFLVKHSDGKRVMIVGGGWAGATLIKEIQNAPKITYKAVCIVDDNSVKKGKLIRGVPIVGTTKGIRKYVDEYGVQEIFITMPSVEKKRISEIVGLCQSSGKPVKILPGLYQLAGGDVTVSKLRQVDVQDLLGREQVSVNLDEIMGYIEHKTVLVTGGGGSIGSELCRQISSHNPETLIILDIYENSVYELERELRTAYPELHLLTLIASVRDKKKMRDVFEKYRPQIVFHAAAHKHVPLMETSPNEAVKNNVFGTLNVAKCADEFGVETFVQISTDKAVNPTNIMGATKRICEMIVQTIGRHSKNTKFVAVRFGNVLGSNGSVIPLFKKQIAEGGPVTVTHKDIIRYFMTIPEAVSLVLQAGAYAKGGQIFVLDMGEPVRIYDLARNLIKLSGYEPEKDIEIVCTGLRPGEKLYEERLMEEEGLQKTPNGLINIAQPIEVDERNFWDTLDVLYEHAYAESDDMKRCVKDLVPTYTIDKRDSIAEALHLATAQEEVAKDA
ncbi:MAG: polysaccharide biosynthesis protein [Clostridia bacterium]|nr:polysaccharide biosynthesis protein [Clostridia bacterium]